MKPFRSKYPALQAVVEYLNLTPAFRNNYKHGRTFKWVGCDNEYEFVKTLLHKRFPECAVKKCTMHGILLWVPKDHAGEKERQRWLKVPMGTSYLESLATYLEDYRNRLSLDAARRSQWR